MLKKDLTLTVLHGETHYDIAAAQHSEMQIRLGVLPDQRTTPRCEVTAIFTGPGADPVAINFSDWGQVGGLELGMPAVLMIGK